VFLWFQKSAHSFITSEDPDVFCIQETKCGKAKLPAELKKVAGYKTYWLSGEKEGYAGMALFSKKEPIKVSYGIGKVYSFIVQGRVVSNLRQNLCPHFEWELYMLSAYPKSVGVFNRMQAVLNTVEPSVIEIFLCIVVRLTP